MEMNKHKILGFFSLAMMNVVIVASLQMMMPCAVYGSSLLFFYFVSTLLFFLPSLLLVAQLVTSYPVTGGSYIWVEKAFGKSWGFFAVTIQWLCNLLWYPTIFSLIATTLAYVFFPSLAESKVYLFISMLILFWGITLLNCFGIKVSSLASAGSAIIGIILPTLILIGFGIYWMASAHPTQIQFSVGAILPNFTDSSQLAFITQVIVSLIGLEMAFVHAGEVKTPYQTIPKALLFSAMLILFIVIAAPLSIAIVIPSKEINVVAGLLDAFRIFFAHFQISPWIYGLMLILIFIGNCGNVTAWMISSTRGMHVASMGCKMPSFFQKTNRYQAPLGILILEAMIFSFGALFFLFFETISNAYWLLLTAASQIALLYYLLIFVSAVKLKKEHPQPRPAFHIPGGVIGTMVAASVAGITCLCTIILGFFPPEQGSVTYIEHYSFFLVGGIVLTLCIPFLFLQMRRSSLR